MAANYAIDSAERALYAAEFALDEVNRLAKGVEVARAQLTVAIEKIRKATMPELNSMAVAFIERMPKA